MKAVKTHSWSGHFRNDMPTIKYAHVYRTYRVVERSNNQQLPDKITTRYVKKKYIWACNKKALQH
jgi:hypothetical protein